jgi:Leucine-rich repeat (LRR) protein/uncharacterized membrane protein
LNSLNQFIGHFHPVLVHLPIGILLVGLLLQWLSERENYKGLKPSVHLIFFCGAVTATISALTGYLLSITDDYDATLVNWHMWMGIGVVIVSFVLYAKEKNLRAPLPKKILSALLLILILITGHLGGSLTHGSDYLTGPMGQIISSDSTSNASIKPITDVQDARVYSDVIAPILQTKCYSCHGASKQKGGLRMDDSVSLMKGGKDGKVISPGHADDSEMIRRLLLPVDDEDHMPPKEKPQPTESQIALLHWWITEGASFSKKVNELQQEERIKPILLALQQVPVGERESIDIPETAVAPADEKVIEQLTQMGIVVMPISRNSNYLSANFVTDTLLTGEELQLLGSLKKQLLWLKMGYTNASNAHMAVIEQFDNLTRLSLEHTDITDEGLKRLTSLTNLRYLNLVGTQVTAQGVMALSDLKSLQSLYLYQTKITEADWATLKSAFPKTRIERGGYDVPTSVEDTTVVKAR